MARIPRGRAALLLAVLLLTLAQGLTVFAQSQANIHIHDTPNPQPVNTTGGATGLSFQTAFSLLDAENQVLTSFEIVDATIDVDGESYEAVVQELDTPWTIVILVDASKTVGSFTASAAFQELRSSLASSVSGVPDNTNIAVFTFADTVSEVFEFDQSKDKAAEAITRIRPRTAGNSCQNNGLYTAINQLAGAPGRRAVILATASLDDCANRTQEDVLSLAQANRVQIYAVGLQGYSATRQGLEAFTEPTGGLAEIRNENSLLFGFSNIFAIFKNQWTARATIYPSAGNKTATLAVNLSDESSLVSDPIEFVSSQDFLPPANIELLGSVQSLADGIVFNLDITQPDKISQINVNVISKATGQAVMSQSLISFSDVNRVPAVSLQAGQEYTLQVVAVDFEGQKLADSQADFTFEPPQATLVVNQVTPPDAGEDSFDVEFSTQNLADAVKFRGWLATGQNNAVIESTRVTVPVGEPLLLPADGVRAGEYRVFVQALDAGDTVLAESQPFEYVYQPPGFFRRLSTWASNSPVALAGLTALCCLTLIGVIAIVWFVVPKNRGSDADVDLVMPERAKQTPSRPKQPRPERQQVKKPERPTPAPSRQEKEPPRPKPKPEAPKPQPKPPAQEEAPSGAGVTALPPEAPSAFLTLIEPKSIKFSTQMTVSPFSVGRHQDNEAALPLDSSSGVSGHHLTIEYVEGVFFVRDEESTYGTSVNEEAVARGKAKQLHNGDIISLGPRVKLKFDKKRN